MSSGQTLRIGRLPYPAYSINDQIWEAIGRSTAECGTRVLEWVDADEWLDSTVGFSLTALRNSTLVHVTTELLAVSAYRLDIVNFTYPIYHAQAVLLMDSQHTGGDHWLSLVNVFSPWVWLSLASLFCLLVTLNGGLHSITPYTHPSAWHWFGEYMVQHSTPVHPLLGTLVITTGVFTVHSLSLYQGCLLSGLVRNEPYVPQVHTLKQVVDMLEDGDAVLNLFNPGYFLAETLMSGAADGIQREEETGDFERLRRALRHNAPVYLGGGTPIEERQRIRTQIERNGQKLLSIADVYNVYHEMMSVHSCSFVYVPTAHVIPFALPVSQHLDSSTFDCLNTAIGHNLDLLYNIHERYFGQKQQEYAQCRRDMFEQSARHPGEPIRVIRLSGILLLFTAGLALAGLVFTAEQVMFAPQARTNRQRTESTLLQF